MQGVPALMILIGGAFLPDTPNSLVERNKDEEGVYQKLINKINRKNKSTILR